jgi:hypothetical protein
VGQRAKGLKAQSHEKNQALQSTGIPSNMKPRPLSPQRPAYNPLEDHGLLQYGA